MLFLLALASAARLDAALLPVLAAWPAGLQAELPSLRFDRLHPLGVAAGGAAEVEVSGRDTEDVTTLVLRGKLKRRGNHEIKLPNTKKAVVTLAEGAKISLFDDL